MSHKPWTVASTLTDKPTMTDIKILLKILLPLLYDVLLVDDVLDEQMKEV